MKNEEVKKEFTDEKTGISYTLVGDYYLPNLTLEQEEKITLNKYGLLRLDYLKKYKNFLLIILINLARVRLLHGLPTILHRYKIWLCGH